MNTGKCKAWALSWVIATLSAVPSARAVDQAAIVGEQAPAKLSEFGFFADLRAQLPADGVLPFSVNTPLFSDHAEKYRFVFVPEGMAAVYDAREAFQFPAGSALIKTFAYPADLRTPGEDIRLVETRVLLKRSDGWDAWAYLWNAEQTDARRLVAGKKIAVGTIGHDGAPLSFIYTVPNKNQCKGCHELNGAITPIGLKARNLNGDLIYATGTANQLETWVAGGMLEGAPASGEWPAVPNWLDADVPVETRSRAWLDVNCAHCHRAGGPASNTGLYLTWSEHDPIKLGIGKRPVAAGRGSFGLEFDIVAGSADQSILFRRVESVEPGIMMPELGRTLPDHRAVGLLSEWIEAMR